VYAVTPERKLSGARDSNAVLGFVSTWLVVELLGIGVVDGRWDATWERDQNSGDSLGHV